VDELPQDPAVADCDILVGVTAFGLAVLSLNKVGRVIEVGLQIASVSLRGAARRVSVRGADPRANQNGAMVGMLCGFVAEFNLWQFTRVPGPGTWRLER